MTVKDDEDEKLIRPDVSVTFTVDSGLMAWIDNMVKFLGVTQNERIVYALRTFIIDNPHCFDKEAALADVRLLNDQPDADAPTE